jgi:hypothetical protein
VSTCPRCTMKCKLPRHHTGGHQCLEDTHLQECFAGLTNSTGIRLQAMCYTQEVVEAQMDQ